MRRSARRWASRREVNMGRIDLQAAPFHLSAEEIRWVEETLHSMTLEQKAGQVFCPMGFNNDPAFLHHIIDEIGVGGLMYRPDAAARIQETHRQLQEMAAIPLLLAANTEAGGNGLAYEGTSLGAPMAVAATGDPEDAYRMGLTACGEGAALGMNWSFAPIVDINYDFHNPITNTRTFGSDPDKVIACARRYMDAARESGVAVAIKHFPGDGVDERDQHILTSVNSLSAENWDATYGRVYRDLIAHGAQTVMVGHIAQPAWVRRINPDATRAEQLRPASLSRELLTGLLRERLGFNGLISTDSTPMVGFTAAMPRRQAIPTAIAAGADMILFNKSLDEDVQFLLDGIREGLLTEERLDEAVTRILATKAALHLPARQQAGTLVPGPERLAEVGSSLHRQWAAEVADKAITLVRDEQTLLPLSPTRYPRVYLNVIQRDTDPENEQVQAWRSLFEAEGFEVTVRDRRVSIGMADMLAPETMTLAQRGLMHEMYRGIEEMRQDYDLYVYIANMENASNNTTLRLNWNVAFGLGDDAPWFAAEIPVLMISTAYPYHLFDAPMIGTYINAYSAEPVFRKAVMDKVMGRSAFQGISPVDALCGKDYI